MDWISLLKYWKYVAMVGLLLTTLYYRHETNLYYNQSSECAAARVQDGKDFKNKELAATEKNKQEVAKTETHWQTIVNEQKNEYDGKLKDAYAAAGAYANRLRIATNSTTRNAGTSSVPQTPRTTGVGEGTSQDPLVPVPTSDLYICAANTVKAQEWQKLWQRLVDSQP